MTVETVDFNTAAKKIRLIKKTARKREVRRGLRVLRIHNAWKFASSVRQFKKVGRDD